MTAPSHSEPLSRIFPWYLWVVAIIVVGVMAGAGFYLNRPAQVGRELSTPAKRLVGHWLLHSQSEVPFSHLFFGPLNSDEGNQGPVSMIDVDGMVFRGKYRVARQYPHGLDMEIIQDLGPNLSRRVSLTIDREGLTGRYRYEQFDAEVNLRMSYVDESPVPPEGFAETFRASKD